MDDRAEVIPFSWRLPRLILVREGHDVTVVESVPFDDLPVFHDAILL
jgi:hypothetical protein